jgi:deoxycytidine triphosphate deaminase
MTIKSDKWIRRMAAEHGMIEPFSPELVREANGQKIVSYGTSSYGYDIRCAREFKVFTNINSTVVDRRISIRNPSSKSSPMFASSRRTRLRWRAPWNISVFLARC